MAEPTQIERLLAEMEPEMRQAFLDAVSDIQDETVIKALAERIAAQERQIASERERELGSGGDEVADTDHRHRAGEPQHRKG